MDPVVAVVVVVIVVLGTKASVVQDVRGMDRRQDTSNPTTRRQRPPRGGAVFDEKTFMMLIPLNSKCNQAWDRLLLIEVDIDKTKRPKSPVQHPPLNTSRKRKGEQMMAMWMISIYRCEPTKNDGLRFETDVLTP